MAATHAFRILGIREGSTPDEIKNAYRIMALQWHPDRHHNTYDKEAATGRFIEVTDAYRTLVREGYVKARPPRPLIITHPEPVPIRMPQPTTPKSGSDSSVSLDSFVHMVASSVDSHTPPPSSHPESARSSWKQGIRQPQETMATHYRNAAPPASFYTHESVGRKIEGPAMYKPPLYPEAPLARRSSRPTPSYPMPLQPRPPRGSVRQPESHPYHHPVPPYPPQHPIHGRSPPQPQLPPYSLPLVSLGVGPSGEWVYLLSLTLEEIFTGKHCRFGITRLYQVRRSKNVVIEIDVPPGCRPGTRIVCRAVGHEWKPGVFQDIAFVIEELPHDRFVRMFDDLIMDVRLPWVDSLRQQGGKVPFHGIDGRNLLIQIDYPRDKNMKGRNVVQGAGMPIREGGQVVGRGNLVVQWEILPPKTKFMHFFKRFWGFSY